MRHCEHPLPLTMAEYEALPHDGDGIIRDHVLDAAYTCGRPVGIRHNGMWLCADHYDAVCRGDR